MKPHKCKHCKEKFETEEHLKEHVSSTHIDTLTIYTCEICQKQFKFKGSYMDHLKSHSTDDIRYECTECPCFFKNHGHLKSHIRDVHGSKAEQFLCKECPKKFDSKASMTQHARKVHSSQSVILKCPHCKKKYASKNSLKWHVHINHNKDYVRSKCPYCPSDFKWPHHLKVHIKKAHIEKGYAPTDLLKKGLSTIRRKTNNCIVCDEKFEKKLDLMLHLKSVHKQELDIYKCCLCTAVFSLRNSLKFHLDEHKRKDIKQTHRCEQCYPESNPILYTENKTDVEEFDGRSEIEKEVIDFELTLMEDEDIRRLIRHRLKHAKKKKPSRDQTVIYKVVVEDGSDIEEFDLITNGIDFLSKDVSLENGVESFNSSYNSVVTVNQLVNGVIENRAVDKEAKVCLERLSHDKLRELKNLKYLESSTPDKECSVCQRKFKLQHSLNEHAKLCHSVEKTDKNKTTQIVRTHSMKLNVKNNEDAKETTVLIQKNGRKIYKCKFCNEKFTKPINLGRHTRLRHALILKNRQGLTNAAQEYTKKTTNTRDLGLKGRKKHHSPQTKPLRSPEAKHSPVKRKRGIAEVKSLNMKLETEKLYECGKCELYFNTKLDLLRHISAIHMAIQPLSTNLYFCDYCNSKFANRSQIIEHLKGHNHN